MSWPHLILMSQRSHLLNAISHGTWGFNKWILGSSLMVQWLKLLFQCRGVRVWYLVRVLRSHMPWDVVPPKKCKKEWYLFLKNGFWGQHNHSVHSKGWFRNEYSIEKWWLHLLVMEKNPITQFLPQIYASPYKYVCRRRYFIWGKHPKGKRWWSGGLLCGSSVSRARTLSNP